MYEIHLIHLPISLIPIMTPSILLSYNGFVALVANFLLLIFLTCIKVIQVVLCLISLTSGLSFSGFLQYFSDTIILQNVHSVTLFLELGRTSLCNKNNASFCALLTLIFCLLTADLSSFIPPPLQLVTHFIWTSIATYLKWTCILRCPPLPPMSYF